MVVSAKSVDPASLAVTAVLGPAGGDDHVFHLGGEPLLGRRIEDHERVARVDDGCDGGQRGGGRRGVGNSTTRPETMQSAEDADRDEHDRREDRPEEDDPSAHARVLGAVGADSARIRREVVEAIPREGRVRHPRMVPVGAVRTVHRRLCGGPRPVRLARGVAQPAQALDEHRIVLLRVGRVDQPAEQLVVPRRRKPEVGADRLFLRSRMPAPFRLELEDGAVAVGQGHAAHANARSCAAPPRHSTKAPSGSTAASGTPSRREDEASPGRGITADATPTCKPGRVDRDPHRVQRGECSRPGVRDRRGGCAAAPRGRDRPAWRPRGARAASAASTPDRRASPRDERAAGRPRRCRAPPRSAPRGPSSPGHTRLRRKRRSSASAASSGARSMPARQTTSGMRSGGSPRAPRTRGRPARRPVGAGRGRRPAAGSGRSSGRGTGTGRRSRRPRAARSGRRSRSAPAAAPRSAAARSSAGCGATHSATTASACAREPPRPLARSVRSGAPSRRVTAKTSGGWRCVAGIRARIAAAVAHRRRLPPPTPRRASERPGASSRAKRA